MDCNSADPENVSAGFWPIEEIPIGNKGMRSKYGYRIKMNAVKCFVKINKYQPKIAWFLWFFL